ncbi:hypothetical protein GE061_014384 [Apolygus lucorum]|uniref:Uncharacterized protein n=1 Tax=Apolygus lucorum TaxID=248454 RepID=A0A8S9XQP4_APOLU|nr:hypothetical protein GE061_014384 [Apolygus lucorum]
MNGASVLWFEHTQVPNSCSIDLNVGNLNLLPHKLRSKAMEGGFDVGKADRGAWRESRICKDVAYHLQRESSACGISRFLKLKREGNYARSTVRSSGRTRNDGLWGHKIAKAAVDAKLREGGGRLVLTGLFLNLLAKLLADNNTDGYFQNPSKNRSYLFHILIIFLVKSILRETLAAFSAYKSNGKATGTRNEKK